MKYKCGKTFWESDNIGFSRNGLWNIPTEIIIDMGATPIDSTCGKCGERDIGKVAKLAEELQKLQPKEEKCEEIELIRAYPHCKHPEYPTNVIVNKVNELITAFNNHIGGK